MKILNSIVLLFSIAVMISCSNASKEIDTRAVQKLDALVETIGELESCSFTLQVFKGEQDTSTDNSFFNEHDVYLDGPDKMYIYSKGTSGKKAYWYDGDSLSFFSFDKNQYQSFKTPSNTLVMIDSVHSKLGIDFPAADFFYPTLTDDIIEYFDRVYFIGEKDDDEVKTYLIEASNDNEVLSIWIHQESNLPYRMMIESKNGGYYDGQFQNWRKNPMLNKELFLFYPPLGSKKAEL